MIGWKKIAGAAALTLACAQAWAVPTLTFSTPSTAPAVGSTVNVDVRIAGISDLYTSQFGVHFDPTLLHLDSAATGNFLESAGDTFDGIGTIDNTAGTLDYAFDTLLGAQAGASGDGVLLHLQFDTLAAGIAALNFSDLLFLDSTGNDIAVFAAPGALQIGAPTGDVPEPASLALFGIGGAAALLRRRRADARARA